MSVPIVLLWGGCGAVVGHLVAFGGIMGQSWGCYVAFGGIWWHYVAIMGHLRVFKGQAWGI